MSKLTIDYAGIESDISTLASNITAINDSLNNINSVEKIIPDSWQSNAASQYRSAVASNLITPIAGIQEGLNNLKDLLAAVLTKYNEEETNIKYSVPTGTLVGTSTTISTPSNESSTTITEPSIPNTSINNSTQPSTSIEEPTIKDPITPIEDNDERLDEPDDSMVIPNIPSTPTNKTDNIDKTPQQPIKSSNSVAKGVASTIIGLGAVGAAGAVGYGIYKKKKRDEEDEEEDTIDNDYNIPEENTLEEE